MHHSIRYLMEMDMKFSNQTRLERQIVAVLSVAFVSGGLFAGYMKIYGLWPVFAAGGGAICGIGFILIIKSIIDDNRKMDEAERRYRGILLQDKTQAAELMRRYNECRERMGKDCCLHPEYRFNPKHRQVVGRD